MIQAPDLRRGCDAADYERARRVIAGGVCSPVRAGVAVGGDPPMVASAAGAHVTGVDGRRYIDYLCAYGPVLLGHAHPGIDRAIANAAARGAVFGATHPEEIRLAERVAAAVPSIDRLRFVTTGTEACSSAVRVARAFTGRPMIVRFAGHYHGHSNEMIFSAGASSNSQPALSAGVTTGTIDDVVVAPYNDLEALATVMSRLRGEVAAIIMEPVAGNMGLVLPDHGFLEGVRALATRGGSLLIFDEVITGFRVGLGGAQALFGVQPDLTCLGKALGGGMPLAAFGGRADVMSALAPEGGAFQGGTFAGNPVSVAAAHAFLDVLESRPGTYLRLSALAARLARGARQAIADAGLSYPVVQLGSMVDFMFRAGPPHRNLEDAQASDSAAYARYYWRMLDRGVYLPPSPMEVMFVTAAHTEIDIDRTVEAMRDSLRET